MRFTVSAISVLSTLTFFSQTTVACPGAVPPAASSSAAASATLANKQATSVSQSSGASVASGSATTIHVQASESVAGNAPQGSVVRTGAAVQTKAVVIEGQTVSLNTSTATNVTVPISQQVSVGTSTSSTLLIIARDGASAYSAYSGLNGYGIPYQVLLVPQIGALLPILNSTATQGNFGGIVIMSEVSYDYGGTLGFQSALTTSQWATLYAYQHAFGVRMVRLDVYPSTDSGTVALGGGCCANGQEQFISVSNNKQFPTAGLKVGATLSTLGLYHYPASITNSTMATEFLKFGTTTGFTKESTAGVITNIDGREAMVFFISFATDWAETSNFLQHTWIHWVTRGLYAGYRRAYFSTQVDDMYLETDMYYPANRTFRIRPADLTLMKSWSAALNKKLNAGSEYFVEIGHNGNGNIEKSDSLDKTGTLCKGGPIEYDDQIDTPLEFVKSLGTGLNIWPSSPKTYPYSLACTQKDPLNQWFSVADNMNAFAHVSHTFTHEAENNSTYYDINNEITWNQAWIKQVGLDKATRFSPNGLIPPAITGLHNGDALRAWMDNGIKHAVGDNTRPVLLNTQNEFWPLMSTILANGYPGVQITPRWATNIYYNCDNPNCTTLEWINTSAGSGDFAALMELEKQTAARHLLGLHHDAYMFHQSNLRFSDAEKITINGKTAQLSLIAAWVETIVQEMVRIVNWPMISLKHDDLAATFASRMARDQCGYKMSYLLDSKSQTVTGVTVTATGNTCSELIPVTVPSKVLDTKGFTTEQIGNDPQTIWVKLAGSPVTFTLATPIPW